MAKAVFNFSDNTDPNTRIEVSLRSLVSNNSSGKSNLSEKMNQGTLSSLGLSNTNDSSWYSDASEMVKFGSNTDNSAEGSAIFFEKWIMTPQIAPFMVNSNSKYWNVSRNGSTVTLETTPLFSDSVLTATTNIMNGIEKTASTNPTIEVGTQATALGSSIINPSPVDVVSNNTAPSTDSLTGATNSATTTAKKVPTYWWVLIGAVVAYFALKSNKNE